MRPDVTPALVAILLFARSAASGDVTVTWPTVSEQACPTEVTSAEAQDGHKAAAVVRKPPGKGPFPAVVFLYGGLNERNVERVKREAAFRKYLPTQPVPLPESLLKQVPATEAATKTRRNRRE